MIGGLKVSTFLATLAAVSLFAGCRSLSREGDISSAPQRESRLFGGRASSGPPVRNVVCLFDQRPWLNADSAADRDPEGIQYRVFLDTGEGKGKRREGTFRVEMYQVGRDAAGAATRTLVSDWHYPSSQFTQVEARVLGDGYRLQLYWSKKDLAGSEVELVTRFEDAAGNVSRSDTKRLRIPKYHN